MVPGEIVVKLVDDSTDVRTQVMQRAEELSLDVTRIQFRTAAVALVDLEAAKAKIRDELTTSMPREPMSVSMDIVNDSIVATVPVGYAPKMESKLSQSSLGVHPVDTASTSQRTLQSNDAPWTLVLTEQEYPGGTASACTSSNYCDEPIRGGIQMNGPLTCTAGFIGKGASTGNPYIVTAGHCTYLPGPWTTKGSDLHLHGLGTSHSSTWDTPRYSDLGTVTIDNAAFWQPTNGWVVLLASPSTGSNLSYVINDIASNTLGVRVCRTGYVSGGGCGTVTANGVDIVMVLNSTEQAELHDAVRTDAMCPLSGDSGGPVFAAHHAYGVTSGRQLIKEGNDVNCYGIYTGASRILPHLNVNINTN